MEEPHQLTIARPTLPSSERLMERSVTSLAEMVRQVRQARRFQLLKRSIEIGSKPCNPMALKWRSCLPWQPKLLQVPRNGCVPTYFDFFFQKDGQGD